MTIRVAAGMRNLAVSRDGGDDARGKIHAPYPVIVVVGDVQAPVVIEDLLRIAELSAERRSSIADRRATRSPPRDVAREGRNYAGHCVYFPNLVGATVGQIQVAGIVERDPLRVPETGGGEGAAVPGRS